MQALALAMLVGSIVLVRGGLKGLNPADSFRDIFSHVPALGVSGPLNPGGSATPNAGVSFSPNVERWRGLVASNFPADKVDEALSVMECESGGDPTARNPTSDASGLFQHLPKYWAGRSQAAGVPNANIYDPSANVRVAGWLFAQSGTWQHWECKPNTTTIPRKQGGGGGSLKV